MLDAFANYFAWSNKLFAIQFPCLLLGVVGMRNLSDSPAWLIPATIATVAVCAKVYQLIAR